MFRAATGIFTVAASAGVIISVLLIVKQSPLVFLTAPAAIGSGVMAWLCRTHARDVSQAVAERTELERQAEERRRVVIDRLVAAIRRELGARGIQSFRLGAFVEANGMPAAEAAQAAQILYESSASRAVADGVITPAERRSLDALALALELDPTWAKRVESEAKGKRFRDAVESAAEDGVFTADELADLEQMRRGLGLAESEARSFLERDVLDVYFRMIGKVVDAGRVTNRERTEIQGLREVAVGVGRRVNDATGRADNLFRRAVAQVLQDNLVEDHERQLMDWLRDELSPSPAIWDEYQTRATRVAHLAACRSGRLPSLNTSLLLESGEICHWVSQATYLWETKRASMRASGWLAITNQKVRFLSDQRAVSFAPSRIMDVRITGRTVLLTLDLRMGTAEFVVGDSEEAEAVLVGVTKRNKYTADFSSSSTRHIPSEVKQAVWHRDGGRCVQCRKDQYLEFDHIIPHSKGGANTVGNVQLLCRGCNLAKSDRI